MEIIFVVFVILITLIRFSMAIHDCFFADPLTPEELKEMDEKRARFYRNAANEARRKEEEEANNYHFFHRQDDQY